MTMMGCMMGCHWPMIMATEVSMPMETLWRTMWVPVMLPHWLRVMAMEASMALASVVMSMASHEGCRNSPLPPGP